MYSIYIYNYCIYDIHITLDLSHPAAISDPQACEEVVYQDEVP